MKSISIKKLYAMHSWVGLITGILMFVIAFTGALSVFGRPELKIWGNPQIRSEMNIDTAQITRVVEELSQAVPEAYREEIILYLPGARTFPQLTILFEKHSTEEGEEQSGIFYTLDNQSYEVIARKEGTIREIFSSNPHDFADFIVDFHADLHLGRPLGFLLTGLLGLTLMLSVVTGFIIHRKKLAQLFTFRLNKKIDVSLADAHKVFGVWGLIFHGIIGFSGAFLGLATVLLIPAAAFVSFGGDQDKLVETFTTMPEPEHAQIYQPTQLNQILEHSLNYQQDTDITHYIIMAYNDKNAVVYANAIGGPQVARQIIQYSGNDGEFIEAFGQFSKVEGFSGVILDLMFPLHFGNFGGIAVKILWAVLGLSTALLPLSGLMLWIERSIKLKNSAHSQSTYKRFNKLVIGSCTGIVLACVALFPTQLILLHLMPGQDFFNPLAIVFFTTWLVATIAPFIIRNDTLSATGLAYICALLMLLTPALNALLTPDNILSMLVNRQWVAFFIDLTLLVFGLLTIYWVRKIHAHSQTAQSVSESTVARLQESR